VTGRVEAALAAARAFALAGTPVSAAPYGSGHINETYLVDSRNGSAGHRTVLQRVNESVFRTPERLMENVERVTAHLARRLAAGAEPDAERRCLRLVPARDGRSFHREGDGSFWRAYAFIPGARSHDVATSPAQAYEAARAFARFGQLLADLPGERLHETIPSFHDTRSRLLALEDAVSRDPRGRLAACRETVDATLRRAPLASTLSSAFEAGLVPERVTHNDTKLNNVLLDDVTGEALCVIDLDTVMPGLFLYDFGDLVRTAASPAAEDETDLSKVCVALGMFEALVDGTLDGLGGLLPPEERRLLAPAGAVATYECGMRFLTDHLEGDGYFRTHRPGHNLDRARAQLALLASMEERSDEMERIVAVAGAEGGGRERGARPPRG